MAPTEAGTEVKKQKRRWLSTVALSTAAFADWCENDTLSILWPSISRSLSLRIGQLGMILGLSDLIKTVTTPFWGYAADHLPRKKLLVWITGIWGLWTMVLGFSQNLPQLVALRVISSLGLGALWPTTFSLLSDLFERKERGRAAGVFTALGFAGSLAAYAILPPLAAMGVEAWRWGFVVMGLLSALSGLFLLVINDPPRGSSEPELSDVITEETAQQYAFKLSDLPAITRIRSWWWVASNQMIDNIPMMVTYGWAFTWLNGLNMGDEAFIVIGLLTLGMMSGHILFGSLGDMVEKRYPNRGRTTMGLIGSIVTIPTLTAMFAFGDRGLGFLMAFGLMAGLSLSSVDTGARWPISQGILYPEIRGTGRAAIDMLAGIVGALAMTFSGHLVDLFDGNVTTMLLLMIPIPKLIATLLWLPLLKTYPRDVAAVRQILSERREEIISQQEG